MVTQILMVALALGAWPHPAPATPTIPMTPATPTAPAERPAPPALPADTVVSVERGVRLDVSNPRGEVVVRAWDRDAVGVESDLGRPGLIDVVRSGSVVRVRLRSVPTGPRDVELEIRVPRWMDVRVEGDQVDVDVAGVGGEVGVETVGGDIRVQGGAGLLSLHTIQGEIHVRDARGRVEAVTVNEDIDLTDVEGDIYLETTNGDATLRGIRSTSVRASTMNGDIVYEGTIRESGRYVLSTHNGDIVVAVPEGADAMVSVSTYHGEFEAEFPVRLTGTTRDRQFTFTLGTGGARIELESFNGEILLRRPR